MKRTGYTSRYSAQVYEAVSRIPKGFVVTYGDIVKKIGGASPRIVGTILHFNPTPVVVPCHRVVNAQGKVAELFGGGGGAVQRKMLEEEGVTFIRDRVDFSKHRFSLLAFRSSRA